MRMGWVVRDLGQLEIHCGGRYFACLVKRSVKWQNRRVRQTGTRLSGCFVGKPGSSAPPSPLPAERFLAVHPPSSLSLATGFSMLSATASSITFFVCQNIANELRINTDDRPASKNMSNRLGLAWYYCSINVLQQQCSPTDTKLL